MKLYSSYDQSSQTLSHCSSSFGLTSFDSLLTKHVVSSQSWRRPTSITILSLLPAGWTRQKAQQKNDDPFDFSGHGIMNKNPHRNNQKPKLCAARSAFELIKKVSFILCCKVCAEANARDSRQLTQLRVNSSVSGSTYTEPSSRKK